MEVPYTNIQLEAEKSRAISVDADSAYGDAVRLTNTTGEKTDVSLKSPEVSIQGNIIATRSNTNISADTATINGNITLNDASSNLSLSNHSEKTANAILNGDVSSKGGISLSNQNIIQESGNFKSENLTADNSSLTFNTVEKGGIAIQKLNGDLKLRAGSKVTETYGTASAALNAIKNDIISTNSEELMKGFTGGEASDLTAAWEYNPESGSVTTLGDASGLSPTLVAAKKTAGANLAQWRYEVNHVSERLGEVRNLQGTVGTWARVYGAEAKLEDSVSTKVKANTIQVGADVRVGDNWIVGGAFGYTDSKADFSNGDSSTDSFNFAAYGTAFFPCGGYVDLIARVGRMSTDVDVATVTDFKSSYDNTTFGVSAEVGYRWDISKTFYLTPQAELSYGLVKGADYTAANEIRVDQDDFQTLVGRLGFQAGMNVADGAGTVYLTASVNHDFQGESDAYARRGDSAVQKLSEDLGGTWVSYGFGGQIYVKDNWSFYGSLTRANGSDYQENYRYSVGTRYCW
ncbi:autotransporter outer membrane beta-barrel domain-containing protein [uncultured Sutterella sp.]|uniref:autotransporter outer membrane beta-barrel domain-containing protein n=1 Tax=uncultured Sutterella sp. TaxID=286133 RepID=UPI00266C72B4|nr:autotransporter outer membrane beta-barrel domain-containing protein [uncultured Sutterella sp.]